MIITKGQLRRLIHEERSRLIAEQESLVTALNEKHPLWLDVRQVFEDHEISLDDRVAALDRMAVIADYEAGRGPEQGTWTVREN